MTFLTDKKFSWLPYAMAVVFVLLLMYGVWQTGRYVNYKLTYEGMVLETLCKAVKPEYLTIQCPENQ